MDLTLYTSPGSGNAYKVELFLRLLRLPYQTRQVDLRRNEQHRASFLARNRFGQIPVLVDGELIFSDSHAILLYLAGSYASPETHDWAPLDPVSMARVARWLSVSANEIQNGLAMARGIQLLGWPMDLERAARVSYRILALMDQHLRSRDWLAVGHATIADVACYPYVMLADEGGIDIAPFTHVVAWMRRVEALPHFWPMPRITDLPPVRAIPPA